MAMLPTRARPGRTILAPELDEMNPVEVGAAGTVAAPPPPPPPPEVPVEKDPEEVVELENRSDEVVLALPLAAGGMLAGGALVTAGFDSIGTGGTLEAAGALV